MTAPAIAGGLAGHYDDAVMYLAGDVHLNGTNMVFARFLSELLQRPPSHLIILGDLFDYWVESPVLAKHHHQVLSLLRQLHQAGWRLDLVCGNRELVAGRLLEISSGCRLHWPRLDVQLGTQHLRIVHGDRLCQDPGYRFFAAWMRSFWWRGWGAAIPDLFKQLIARGLRYQSLRQHRRRAATPTMRRVFLDRRKVQAAARGCDTLLAGHIHESWRRQVGGVDLIVVGDWPGDSGHWVEGFRDGRLERRKKRFPVQAAAQVP
jgi:UDP-2,3-diacylglucosamine hydrolase